MRPTRAKCLLRPQCRMLNGPARLIGLGFRGWMTGYRTGDISCWERVFRNYSNDLGDRGAARAVDGLSEWVRTVQDGARRPIAVAQGPAPFCSDECLAVALIAAAQNDTCPAMRACATALLGSEHVEPTIDSAQGFAHSLAIAGRRVDPSELADLQSLTPTSAVAH